VVVHVPVGDERKEICRLDVIMKRRDLIMRHGDEGGAKAQVDPEKRGER